MKILVACYSRTGRTRKAGQALAVALDRLDEVQAAHFVEIVDTRNRAGAWGFVRSAKDAMLGKDAQIEPICLDVADFDAVVVGTPVWAATYAPAAGAFVRQCAQQIRRVAFLATQRSSGDKKTYRDLTRLAESDPLATCTLIDGKIASDDREGFIEPITDFARRIVRAMADQGAGDAPGQPQPSGEGRP